MAQNVARAEKCSGPGIGLGLVLCLWLATAANAQQSWDIDPPVIEHDVLDGVEPAQRQGFYATVADDAELDSVMLYHRRAGERDYQSTPMREVSFSSTFIARIDTDPADRRAIEYYIEARDVGGNRTLRGYSFSPMVRRFSVPSDTVSSTPPSASANAEMNVGEEGVQKALYWVLGALAVGVVLGVASSGGNDGPSSNCSNDQCRLDFVISPPELQ